MALRQAWVGTRIYRARLRLEMFPICARRRYKPFTSRDHIANTERSKN